MENKKIKQDYEQNNKAAQVKEAINQILAINRQRELLAYDLANHFQLLKNLGFPKNIVSATLKKRSKPTFQLESERMLIEELEGLMGD
jgi:hypothetical protein